MATNPNMVHSNTSYNNKHMQHGDCSFQQLNLVGKYAYFQSFSRFKQKLKYMYQISLNQNMHQLLKKITLFQNPLPHNCHETCNKMLVKSIYTKTCYTKYPTLTLFLQTHKSKLNF